jgi:hypothetical protein
MWALWVVVAVTAIGAVWSAVEAPAPTAPPAGAPAIEPTPAPAPVPKAGRATEPPQEAEAPILDRPEVPWAPAWSPGEVPADQLERGDASLHFKLVGDRDAAPVAMRVRLWRLGVAESDTWTAGDEVRGTFEVHIEGYVETRLPTGRYRFQCLDRRHDSEDPPEFVLNSGKNERVIPVANRRTLRVRVRILDEVGAPRTRAILGEGGGGMRICHESERVPPWASPREAKTGPHAMWWWGSGIGCGPGRPGSAVDADATGCFALRPVHESGIGDRQDRSYEFRIDDGGATVRIDDELSADTTFLWVVPRAAALLAHVSRPDGTPIDPAKARVDIQSEPLECPWDPPEGAWRSVPVKVHVHCEGFQSITFVWRGDAAGERHVLVPKSSK